jgi:hypothetical protein
MPAINKPSEFNIWASAGSAIAPTNEKYAEGWVVETPPHQTFNYLLKKHDTAIAHCNQYGFFEWDATTEYQANKSWTLGSNGSIYFCKVTNTNNNPVTDVAESFWRKVMDGNTVLTFPNTSTYIRNTFLPSADAATARSNLGITTVGNNLATAVSSTAARASLGSGTIGDQLFTSASAVSARSIIGVVDADDSTKGLVQRATDPEAISGVDDTKFLTPKKLKLGFSVSLTSNGWIRFPSWIGSFQVVWGSFLSSVDYNILVNFPLAFPNQCFGVCPAGTTVVEGSNKPWSANGITSSYFYANRDDSVNGTDSYRYFAFGY